MEYRDPGLNRISEAVAVTPSTDELRTVDDPYMRVSDRRMDNSQLPVNLGIPVVVPPEHLENWTIKIEGVIASAWPHGDGAFKIRF